MLPCCLPFSEITSLLAQLVLYFLLDFVTLEEEDIRHCSLEWTFFNDMQI